MTTADLSAFTAAFQRLRTIFALRADRAELDQIIRVYFRVLSRYPIEAVEAGADACTVIGTKFPKPAEWLRAIPNGGVAIGVAELSSEEAAEHREAAARHYEGDPCACFLCRQAGVTHRMLRYVPDVDVDDRDLRGVLDGRVVVRGHWAHGDELARWYVARDRYLELRQKYPPKTMRSAHRVRRLEEAALDVIKPATVQAAETDVEELLS